MTFSDRLHPGVAAAFFVGILCFCMLAFQPVYLLITLASGLAYNVYLRGGFAAARSLRWQLPLFLLVAIINPLISPIGSTLLFQIGSKMIFLESLLYGVFMGVMLVSMLIWFSNAAAVLTSDKLTSLAGGVMPTVGLMISMVMRLVPHFVRRGTLIAETQAMNTAGALSAAPTLSASTSAVSSQELEDSARTSATSSRTRVPSSQEHVAATSPAPLRGAIAKASSGLRQISVLMGWGMEDSLETAQSMRARGWGSAPRRTTYRRQRFRSYDGVALGVVIALILVNAAWYVAVHSGFHFYPAVTGFVWSPSYLLYAAFAFLPLIAEGIDRIRWNR